MGVGCLPGGQPPVGAVGGGGEWAAAAALLPWQRPACRVTGRGLRKSKHTQAFSSDDECERHRACTWTRAGVTVATQLLALVVLRWLCSSLVVPSWKVLGKAPSSMVNSGVLSSNRAISTTWAACMHTRTHTHRTHTVHAGVRTLRFPLQSPLPPASGTGSVGVNMQQNNDKPKLGEKQEEEELRLQSGLKETKTPAGKETSGLCCC